MGIRPVGLVPKSPVRICLVPIGKKTTERVAFHDWQGEFRQMQVWSSDDGHTRRGGPRRAEWREWRGLRGRKKAEGEGGVEEEEEVDLLECFFYYTYEFPTPVAIQVPAIIVPDRYAIRFVRHPLLFLPQ